MLYIAENLRALRLLHNLTQEELSNMLGVSPQSVSKWERGATYPDITLLPALAGLFKTSVDSIIGMDKIVSVESRNVIFAQGQSLIRDGDYIGAAEVYESALKTFPNDKGIMSELAFALALSGDARELSRAIELCELVLEGGEGGEKVRHTTRAALCFIYMKAGETQKAFDMAHTLPHRRESREDIVAHFISYLPDRRLADVKAVPKIDPVAIRDELDMQLRFIAVGSEGQQHPYLIELGLGITNIAEPGYGLLEKIVELRREVGAFRLPVVQIRDNVALPANRVTVNRYAYKLLDMGFDDNDKAVAAIIGALRRSVCS